MTRDEALETARTAFDRLNKECADIDTVDLADRHAVSIIAELLVTVDTAARAEERAACARECDLVAVRADDGPDTLADECARRIRARGERGT